MCDGGGWRLGRSERDDDDNADGGKEAEASWRLWKAARAGIIFFKHGVCLDLIIIRSGGVRLCLWVRSVNECIGMEPGAPVGPVSPPPGPIGPVGPVAPKPVTPVAPGALRLEGETAFELPVAGRVRRGRGGFESARTTF